MNLTPQAMRSLARSFVLVAAVASAAKKQKDDKIKITFTNKLDGPATLYVMGKKMHAFAAQGEKHSARSSDGQSWTAHDARGGEVFHYVVREKDGPDQRVDVSRGVSRRTIMSIVESEDHHLHRVDGGGDANAAGCADPVRAGDRVNVVATGVDGAPRLSFSDHVVHAVGDSDPADAAWIVEGDGEGPLFPGGAVFLKSEKHGVYLDAPPPVEGKHVPLLARWRDRGDFQRFMLFKAPDHDDAPLSALCYGDAAYLLAHTRNFVDVSDGAAYARWRHRGDWQSLAFERAAAAPGHEEL